MHVATGHQEPVTLSTEFGNIFFLECNSQNVPTSMGQLAGLFWEFFKVTFPSFALAIESYRTQPTYEQML